LSNDRHASIFVDEPPAAHTPVRQRSVSRVDILPDSVGYLRVEEFDEDLYSRLPTLMSHMAAVPALIIDIRDCPGGDGGVMLALAGYLLPQRTRLGSLYSRRDSSTTDIWTEEPKGARFMDRPVYILTSRSTFSAAEAFAYHIQAFGRVIVVGDTTGGGAHRVHDVDLGENMQMALPYTCVMNAVTGTDWEGIGVIPNVCASPDEALDAARKEAERARRGATRH
jgi:C-terminal processing protease CtpA/Prc